MVHSLVVAQVHAQPQVAVVLLQLDKIQAVELQALVAQVQATQLLEQQLHMLAVVVVQHRALVTDRAAMAVPAW